jgi:pSer/pThr/pTyr-binding forkhead associated (FHA) protein
MSRDHFALEAGLAAVVLRDLGSTNGTFVNNTRVERHMLAEGDIVRAGATSFQVRLSLGGLS